MILLIGATSFLGPPVISGLTAAGYQVRCMLRSGNDREKLIRAAGSAVNNLFFCRGNLLSSDSMIHALKDASAAVYMVDLAGTGFLENFLHSVSKTDLHRVVFISSTTVLIPLKSRIKDSKIKSEDLIRKSNLDYTILRPSMIYGVPDDPNFSRMLKFIKKRRFFMTFGSGKNLIQPVFIEDVAGAVVSVMENKATFKKVYNLAGLEPMTYNGCLKIVKQKTGINFRVIRVPQGLGKAAVSIYSRLSKKPSLTPGQIDRMEIDKNYDYQQAKDDFGFSPVSFKEGIGVLISRLY